MKVKGKKIWNEGIHHSNINDYIFDLRRAGKTQEEIIDVISLLPGDNRETIEKLKAATAKKENKNITFNLQYG
jgi:hypothetical protein